MKLISLAESETVCPLRKRFNKEVLVEDGVANFRSVFVIEFIAQVTSRSWHCFYIARTF